METNRTVEFVEHVECVEYAFLIGECWNGLESLEILELVELPGEAGRS